MSKKRNISKRKYRSTSRRRKKYDAPKRDIPTPTKSILTYVFKQKEPITINDIYANIDSGLFSKKQIREVVLGLVSRGDLSAVGKKRYTIDANANIFSGIVEKNPRGFGFVTSLQPRRTAASLKKDPFLSIKRIGSANHGDEILFRVNRVRKDGRPEAEIIAILNRFTDTLTGYYQQGSPPKVIPEDPRYPSTIYITEMVEEQIPDKHVVIVQVLPESSPQGHVQGKLIEVLGPAEDIDVQMRIVIEKHNLPHIFSAAALREAEQLTVSNDATDDRLDLRAVCHVTIDGETAKDFDDAVAVEKLSEGYRLYVSIADVSHFVAIGSALDKEAYERGTSIYFPGRVIPMLPEKLSNDLCSLLPRQDRLAFSAILDFNEQGKLITKKFTKSIIQSKSRLTYSNVFKMIVEKDADCRTAHADLIESLDHAKKLAEALLARRMKRGSIGFNIPEPEITLADNGRIENIKRKQRNFAHQLIEEFMLAANEAVAESFTAAKRHFLYRIHEQPDEEKVSEFAEFSQTMGLDLPPLDNSPPWFAKVLEHVKGQPAEYVVNNLLLRTMQQARYSSGNTGHFGLAATDYTHFTSPIRRYPDLIVHRLLSALIEDVPLQQLPGEKRLVDQAVHLSSRERSAIAAERNVADRLKIFFMEQFIGERFKAVISGINESVIFVELIDLFVSGAVDVAKLTDDYYLFDGRRHRFIGDISGKIYQLGAAIEVVLLDVDLHRQRINFVPA
ncbi:MAG: ribonuclease R [Desulfocapsaceae bacterium]|nr:ribonuclease R [Desulfocapsaceae bacterium]